MVEEDTAKGPLEAVLEREDIQVAEGLVTVLVAPEGCSCAELAGFLSDPSHGLPVRVLSLDETGAGSWGDLVLQPRDDDAWADFAQASSEAGETVVVSGNLAEAASAAVWFSPGISLTDGGSIEEARLRLSAISRKSRMAGELMGGDFEAVFGSGDVPDHAALSDLVGRIVGYAWRLEGGVTPDKVAMFPDGLDNLSTNVALLAEPDPDDEDGDLPVWGGAPTEAEALSDTDAPGDGSAPVDKPSGTKSLGDLPERVLSLCMASYVPVLSPFDGDVADGGSRSFGRAFVPTGTDWPRGTAGPLDLVLQLEIATLPEEARALLGGAGDFQVFVDLGNPPLGGEAGGFLARVVDTSAPGGYVEGPSTTDTWKRVPRSVLSWREVRDAPDATEFNEGRLVELFRDEPLADEAIGLLVAQTVGQTRADGGDVDYAVSELDLAREGAERLADALEHHGTDKLLGWPSWTQGAEWPTAQDGRAMRLLFQFQMWGGLVPDGELAPNLIASDGTAQVFATEEGEPEYAFGWACS